MSIHELQQLAEMMANKMPNRTNIEYILLELASSVGSLTKIYRGMESESDIDPNKVWSQELARILLDVVQLANSTHAQLEYSLAELTENFSE